MAGAKAWEPADEIVSGRAPVRLGDAILHRFESRAPDAAWRKRFAESRGDQLDSLPVSIDRVVDDGFRELARRAKRTLHGGLLAFGGWEVCMPALDDDLDKVVGRGFLLTGAGALLMRGEPCRCHGNSAAIWQHNKGKTAVMTGYAMSGDGMWREHSWVVARTPGGAEVIETTTPREAYFGFIRTPREAQALYDAQMGWDAEPWSERAVVARMGPALAALFDGAPTAPGLR